MRKDLTLKGLKHILAASGKILLAKFLFISDNKTPISMFFLYQFLFITNYNLDFYSIKKDLCKV